jgi:hypothetical protein
MDEEELTPLPLSRMSTISKPSFWIYMAACMVLYAGLVFSSHNPTSHWRYSAMVGFCAFFVLLLELVSQWLKNKHAVRYLNIACYVFEIASILFFLFIIFYN